MFLVHKYCGCVRHFGLHVSPDHQVIGGLLQAEGRGLGGGAPVTPPIHPIAFDVLGGVGPGHGGEVQGLVPPPAPAVDRGLLPVAGRVVGCPAHLLLGAAEGVAQLATVGAVLELLLEPFLQWQDNNLHFHATYLRAETQHPVLMAENGVYVTLRFTYAVNCVDKRIHAWVAHSQPVAGEEDDVDVVVAETMKGPMHRNEWIGFLVITRANN